MDKVQQLPANANPVKDEEEISYNLAASREGLGELSPVLKDAFGNVIDGFHRLGENANWHAVTVPSIDNPIKLELARLAVNFNRRKVTVEELTQRITFLITSGLKPDEIAKQTGINERTIYRHIPQELKDAAKVEQGGKRLADTCQFTNVNLSEEAVAAGKASAKARTQPQISVPQAEQTIEHDLLVSALDTAAHPFCPQCAQDPVKISPYGLPIVLCSNDHAWSLQKGSLTTPTIQAKPATGTYLDDLEECCGCRLMVNKKDLVDGKCHVCREKEAAAEAQRIKEQADRELNQTLGMSPAPIPAEMKQQRTVRPVNLEAKGCSCPCCGVTIGESKYEALKKKFSRYEGLFR